MITCPACGKENEDSALDCKRCRAPLREDAPPEEEVTAAEAPAEAAPAEAGEERPVEGVPAAEPPPEPAPPEAGRESLGEWCPRWKTSNAPGVRVCPNWGSQLSAAALAAAAPAEEASPHDAPMDKTPPQAYAPPHDA